MLGLHSTRRGRWTTSCLTLLVAACGGRISDDLPPLAPPATPPLVLPNTAQSAAPPAAQPPAPMARVSAQPAAPPAPLPPPPSAPREPTVPCVAGGHTELPSTLLIEAPDGGAIGRFSGGDAEVSVSELTLGAAPRAHVQTGTGRASFRVNGWVKAGRLPLVTTRAVEVIAQHVWIAERTVVSIRSVSNERLEIERAASSPLAGSFKAFTSCAALTLDAEATPAWSPFGDARAYVLRGASLDLYDMPQGNAVGMLRKAAEQRAVLFFSREQRLGFVHVERHGDIVVDAWVAERDVTALPRGETLDEAGTATKASVARLALPGAPRVVKTTRDVPLRASARDGDPSIGTIAPDTETYVVEVTAGWVSVLPRALDVLPPEGRHFWVKRSDLSL